MKVIDSSSVNLTAAGGAGATYYVGLTDLVTERDGSSSRRVLCSGTTPFPVDAELRQKSTWCWRGRYVRHEG
ncbi:hypothetical protein KCP71_13925 [Salmonella enterica subsp. enterica]|nr:hypothetical protein KCP71_13925 [Salmonella enterica subsp. enterica]